MPPVSLGYVARALLRGGVETRLLDCIRDALSYGDFERAVAPARHAFYGFTVFSNSVGSVARYASILRRLHPEAVVAAGGPHAIYEPEELLERIPEIDFAYHGECESSVAALVRAIEAEGRRALDPANLAAVPNLAWREGGRIRLNPKDFPRDLDAAGIQAWEIVHPERYPTAPNGIFTRHRRVAPVIATRGCPYACTFCGAPRSMGRPLRKRSPENLVEELSLLRRQYGIREVHFLDDNFTMDLEHAKRACEAIARAGLGLALACPNGIRLDRIDRELLALMERAGFYSVAVGIESGSQRILDAMRKHLTLEVIERQVRLIKASSRIRVTGFFILGFPDEEPADLEATIRLARRLPLDRANFFNFTPFPGGPLYDELKASGRLRGVSLDDLYIHNITFPHPRIPPDALRRIQRRAYLSFYRRPRILWGLLREIKSLFQLRVLGSRMLAVFRPRVSEGLRPPTYSAERA